MKTKKITKKKITSKIDYRKKKLLEIRKVKKELVLERKKLYASLAKLRRSL